MQLGGENHSGWLPPGAAEPPATPVVHLAVDLVIEGDEKGAMLYWDGSDGSHYDYWRESVEGAMEQAELSWGVHPHEWSPGDLRSPQEKPAWVLAKEEAERRRGAASTA